MSIFPRQQFTLIPKDIADLIFRVLFHDILIKKGDPIPHMTVAEPINLSLPSTSIAIFLDSCATASSLNYTSFTFVSLHQHHRLVKYLDCPRLIKDIETSYKEACRTSPVEYLSAASLDGDVEGVKRALQRCR